MGPIYGSLLFVLFLSTSSQARQKILIETDFKFDVDDAVAMSFLFTQHKRKLIEVIGININSTRRDGVHNNDYVPGGVYSLTTDAGINVPVGATVGEMSWNIPLTNGPYREAGWLVYQRIGPFPLQTKDVPKTVDLYRQVLCRLGKGEKATIVSLGYMTGLHEILSSSKGGAACPFTGIELIRNRIEAAVIMGGSKGWGTNNQNYSGEHNFYGFGYRHTGAAVNALTNLAKIPTVFVTEEIDPKGAHTVEKRPWIDAVKLFYCYMTPTCKSSGGTHFDPRKMWDVVAADIATLLGKDPQLLKRYFSFESYGTLQMSSSRTRWNRQVNNPTHHTVSWQPNGKSYYESERLNVIAATR